MKTHIYMSFLAILFTINFGVNLPVQAQSLTGVMMVVKGDIKVTTKAGQTEVAKVGRKVSSGDLITSGPDSRAKIVMADKNVINISPDSKIMIEKYENDGKDKKNVELNVLYGKVRASVDQKYDGEKSKFNIKTPSAVAGVRGTDFMAGYNPSTKVTQVITFSGTVAVGQPGPGGSIKNPVFVQPGQMTQAGAGQAPESPKPVPSEDLNKLNNDTKADAAPSPSPSANTEPTDKPEAKKEASANDPAKEPGKEPEKQETAAKETGKSDRGPASDGSASGGSPGPGSSASSGETPAPNASGPGNGPPPPTTSAGSQIKPDVPSTPGGGPIAIGGPQVMMPPTMPSVYVPPQNTFIDNAVKNSQKTRLSITITNPGN